MFDDYEELTDNELLAIAIVGTVAMVAHFVWSYIL